MQLHRSLPPVSASSLNRSTPLGLDSGGLPTEDIGHHEIPTTALEIRSTESPFHDAGLDESQRDFMN